MNEEATILKAIYLKVNRFSDYLIPCVQSWVDVFKLVSNAEMFFICDKPDLKDYIEKKIDLSEFNCEWISSARQDPDLQFIVDKTIVDNWKNAAYAHLTTFLHARNHGYEDFWNIDADDIRFFIDPEKSLQILNEVEKVANQNKIRVFSLDIHYSCWFLANWSFGMTFVKNSVDWITLLKNMCDWEDFFAFNNQQFFPKNIDCLFGTMRLADLSEKIETYYVENLRFEHYVKDRYTEFSSGIRYCENNRYHFSILEHDLGMNNAGACPIAEDDIKIDIGLTADDSYQYLMKNYSHQFTLKCFVLATQKIDSNIVPEFSVLIDTDNQGIALWYCLWALAMQTFRNFEVIVIARNRIERIISSHMNRLFAHGITTYYIGGGGR